MFNSKSFFGAAATMALLLGCNDVERVDPGVSGEGWEATTELSSADVSSSSEEAVSSSSSSVAVSCKNVDPGSVVAGYLCDGDGQAYKTVEVDGWVWMAENMNRYVTDSWCYENKPANCDKYGRLYGYEIAKTICPTGWALPDSSLWSIVIEASGGYQGAGLALKSTTDWEAMPGENSSGFNALPGGYAASGASQYMGTSSRWWSSDRSATGYITSFGMSSLSDGVSVTKQSSIDGLYVRCMKL